LFDSRKHKQAGVRRKEEEMASQRFARFYAKNNERKEEQGSFVLLFFVFPHEKYGTCLVDAFVLFLC
jgi:hypothetical protein